MKTSAFWRKDPISFSRQQTKPVKNKLTFAGAWNKDLVKDWGTSWFEALKIKFLVPDFLAAITVAAVALPLNLALAVACGLPPHTGLLAGAIGGGIAAIFGGARLQITGPSAALNVMVIGLTKDFGAAGVAGACLIIGIIQLLLSFISAGRFVRFVPEAVLAGFSSGVGLKLLDQQIPDLLGFNYTVFKLAEMTHRPQWLHEVSWLAVVCGLFVALLMSSFKQFKRFPAALIGIALITYVANHLNWNIQRVGAISGSLGLPQIPNLQSEKWFQILIATFPLALLASIESLLSAQSIDRLTSAKKLYNPHLELLGQALGNFGSALVGGMPVSGGIVRSTVNAQSGGKTRLVSVLHCLMLLAAMLYLGDGLATIPLSALAGLLCVVGLRLIEVNTLLNLLRVNKLEALAFLAACIGTTSGRLMIGLASGISIYVLSQILRRTPVEEVSTSKKPLANGIRAVIQTQTFNVRKPNHYNPQEESTLWLSKIREKAHLAASSFIHHKASVIGKVILGEHVHIAAESSVRADEGSPFYIGSNSNIQDGVVIHALKEKWVNVAGEDWAVYIGENVSVAHQALVHGPCYIGAHSFVGFQAIVHDSIVGNHCYIGIGAIVVGVEIPEGRYIPHGSVIDNFEKVDALPKVSDAHLEFNEDVVGVNRGLAAAYRKHSGQATISNKYPKQTHKWRLNFDRF